MPAPRQSPVTPPSRVSKKRRHSHSASGPARHSHGASQAEIASRPSRVSHKSAGPLFQAKRSAWPPLASGGRLTDHHSAPKRAHAGNSSSAHGDKPWRAASISPTSLSNKAITSATTPKLPTCGSFSTARKRAGSRCAAPRPSARSARPSRCRAPVSHTHSSKVSAAASQGSTWAKGCQGSKSSAPISAPTGANQRPQPASQAGSKSRSCGVGRRVRNCTAKISSRIRALQRQQPGRLWRIARQAQPAAARHRHPPRQRPGHGHRLGQQRRNHPAMA